MVLPHELLLLFYTFKEHSSRTKNESVNDVSWYMAGIHKDDIVIITEIKPIRQHFPVMFDDVYLPNHKHFYWHQLDQQ